MSFTIRLAQDLTAVEAGATVPLSIEVTNRGTEIDRFEMQVEGLDPEWTASPEPVFNVGPGDTHAQKVFFKPPRASESVAGNYPFVVRVRSLNSGDTRTAQGVLQVKAYHHLSMELSPKKGYISPMRHQNSYAVTIMNLGNTEHTLQLNGADPEELCTFDFEQQEVTIGPGQQKVVEVTVNAAKPSLVASSQLYGFVISGRSVQNPNLVANTQGQLEQRPLISLAGLALVVFLLAIFALWFAVRPQPAKIRLSADNVSILRGNSATVFWEAANANSVTIEITHNRDGKVDRDTLQEQPLKGNRTVVATDEDTITVKAYAVTDTKQVTSTPVTINVQEPPAAVPPKILSFKANTHRVKLGESLVLTFKFSSDVTKAVLAPTNQEIVPAMTELEVIPNRTGDITYELIAFNQAGGQARSKVSVNVYQASDANILDFSASPLLIEAPNDTTVVTWRVSNAVLVQLDDGTGLRTVDAINADGLEVRTDKNIQLKLIATDAKGVTTSKIIKVKYKPLPPPTDTPPTTGGDLPTTGSTTGGTTTTTTGGGQ